MLPDTGAGVRLLSEVMIRGMNIKINTSEAHFYFVTDFTRLNRFIDRPVHPFPTTEHIQQAIHPSSRYFAKVDLVSAYHQIPLAKED